MSHALSLRTDTRKAWDFEVVGAVYRIDRDRQRFPNTVSGDSTFAPNGRVAMLDGTGWITGDAKASWHRAGLGGKHVVSFGVHGEHYRLQNPTFNSPDWTTDQVTTVASAGNGKTETVALWVQDAWKTSQLSRLTLGVRLEKWRGFDGYNVNGNTAVAQEDVSASRISPKLSFNWLPGMWQVTASLAKAYRFATPAELYQLVTTGATFTAPDPSLKPDDVLAAELRLARLYDRGMVQVSLFQDDVRDAIISQFQPLVPNSTTLYSYLSNVDHVRARGVELAMGGNDLLVHGLELSGSVTWLDARTLAMSGRASASAPAGAAIGKFLPNIPKWRAGFATTYHASESLALSLGGRYSSKLYTTLDNSDVRFNTYPGFDGWFVMDARANYDWSKHWSSSLGVDNLLDRKYFLFHPFPQRTLVGSAKYRL
jgi:iron complex outermembrane receptor protein